MLARSSTSSEDELKNIVNSTSAVIFLATPHRGSPELAALGEWARSLVSALRMETNDAILNALSLRNTDLERAQESFSALWLKYDFRVKTFQEGLGLTGVNLSVLGNKVVPDYSSLIGDARERAETIQANHMDMCRFTGRDDPNYSKLSGEVRLIYTSLVNLNAQKIHHNGHIQRHPRALSIRSVKAARQSQARTERHPDLSDAEVFGIRPLWYPSMDERRNSVEEPAVQTCLWLFEQKSYQDWLHNRNQDEHCGLLWLKGKPGAGKSTLMKEAFRRAEAQQAECGYSMAAFFFHAKGSEMQHSSLGLFRSLLHQLLPRHPLHLRRFTQLVSSKENLLDADGSPDFSEQELGAFLRSMFTANTGDKTIIFIDALDECDSKTIRSQAYFWREVTKSASAAGTHLSVCLSSRHFPAITVTNCPEIIVDHYNKHDIITYVDQRLGLGIPAADPDGQALRDRILAKSAGVFLWVTLVVDDVLQKRDEGKGLRCLLGELDNVPEELETLFSALLQALAPNLKRLTLRLFQWAVLATRPLRLYEWHHILGFIQPTDIPPPSLSAWRESGDFAESLEQLAKRIKTLSRGLVEVVSRVGDGKSTDSESRLGSVDPGAGSMEFDQGENCIVQVIHESVREFFLHGGGSSLADESATHSFVGQGHISIIGTCLDYINIHELDALVEARITRAKSSARGYEGSVKSFASAHSYSNGDTQIGEGHDSVRPGLTSLETVPTVPPSHTGNELEPKVSAFERLKRFHDAAWIPGTSKSSYAHCRETLNLARAAAARLPSRIIPRFVRRSKYPSPRRLPGPPFICGV